MAISWGAWEYSGGNGMRVGIEVEWEAVGHAETVVTATVRIYTENQFTYGDGQTLSYGGAIGGSTNFTNNDGGAPVLRATKTYDYTYGANSYGESPGDRTFTATLSGAYNGVTPSKSVTSAIPARPIAAPAAPTAAAVSRISDVSTKVTWVRHATSGEPYASQTVQREINGSGSWATVSNSGGAATSYTDGTVANQKYRYRVRANNSAGSSSYSTSGYIYTTPEEPTAPSRADIAGPGQRITWTNAGMGYSDYVTEVIAYKNGVSQGVIASLATGVTTYDHLTSHGTVPYTASDKWKYTVRHKTSTGTALYSAETAFTTETAGATSAPAAPTNLSPNGVTVDPTVVNALTWLHNPTDTTAQTQFQIRHRVVGAGSWTTESVVTSGTSSWNLPANTYTNGQQFEWQVTTKGSDAAFSPWSSSATVNALITKLIPVRYNLAISDREVDLTGFDWKTIGVGSAPSFLNSWVNYDASGSANFADAAFRRIGGIVYIKGLVKSGTISATSTGNVFVLPAGYRPGETLTFLTATAAASGLGILYAMADGSVRAATGNNGFVSLQCCFPADL